MALADQISEESSVTHRNIFRGKNLGTTFTAAQKAAIRDGSFDDLWVGDYWKIGNYTYRIADINYWKYLSDNITKVPNHLVIVSDEIMANSKWANNQSDTEHMSYYNSLCRQVVRSTVRNQIISDFGEDSIIKYGANVINSVSNGNPSSDISFDTDVENMNEIMVFGSIANGITNTPTTQTFQYCTDGATQLALFRLNTKMIVPTNTNEQNQYSYFLRENTYMCKGATCCKNGRPATSGYAHNSNGIRPAFPIG